MAFRQMRIYVDIQDLIGYYRGGYVTVFVTVAF